ncbi:hypothetical protein BH23CHL2_BH23CHL2_36430 [soil metagenome]
MLDRVLLQSLRPVFLGAAVILAPSAIYRGLSLPFEQGLIVIALGALLSGLCLKAYWLVAKGRVPSRLSHPLAAAMVAASLLMHLYGTAVQGDPERPEALLGLAMMLLVSGVLYLRLRWFLGMMAFTLASWTVVNLRVGLDLSLFRAYFYIAIIVLAALMIYAARKRAISQMIDAQLEVDQQNTHLASALERAHQSEAQLKVERDLADQVVDSMGQGLVLVDDSGMIEYVNPAAEHILDGSSHDLTGRPAHEILPIKAGDLRERIGTGSDFDPDESIEVSIEHADGGVSNLLVSITSRESGGGILTLTDLTLRKKLEAKLTRLAHYDALTGLANRSLLIERLQQALVRIERSPSRIAVLFLDLDRFKPINDTAGHAVGDQVLIEIASRIQSCIRAQDTAARVGGDEFVVLLTDVEDTDMTLEVADRIVRQVQEPVVVDGRPHTVSISIGIVTSRSADADPEDLIGCADMAMYEAKRRSDVSRILYTPDLRPHFQHQLV